MTDSQTSDRSGTTSTLTARIVFDIETDGLNPTSIFCVCTLNMNTDERCTFTDKEGFAAFVEENKDAHFYAHNGICFDYRVLLDLWDIDFSPEQQYDTLVLSRLASPSRAGGHSLEQWGTVLNFRKLVQPSFDSCTPELIEYCERDVDVTARVLEQLDRELEGFDEQSIALEHAVARIIFTQEQNGWLLDQRKAFELVGELKEKKYELEETVHRRFRPQYKAVKEVTPKTNKDGSTSVVGLKYLGDSCLSLVGGVHTRVDLVEFNLGSRKQIGERLQQFGWVPSKFTDTGQPVVSEVELARVKGIPEASLIADYLTVEKRIAMAQSWLDLVSSDGRVHGKVNSNGAVTGRMTHYQPNMAQVTSGSKIYGKEMRECWIAPPGTKIVGVDADALELCMLAHYMDDAEYIQSVETGDKDDGTDTHTKNQRAAGLPDRDTAKTFIYAFLYGAGDAKIGSIAGGGRKAGKELKARFLQRTPALARLKERVERASGRGWLKGLDGRRIAVRSRHSALNTLLQGAGAVLMKQALVNLVRMADANGVNYKLVGNIHDEIQAEVLEEHAEKFGKLACYAIAKAGVDLGLRCKTRGSYHIGDSWRETH